MRPASVFRAFLLRFSLLGFLLATCAAARAQTVASAAIDGFDPNPNGVVYAVSVQPDGKILVAGSFTNLWPNRANSPIYRNAVARLNADGSVDPTFDPNVTGQVYAMARQPNGQIVLGGQFTAVGGVTRNQLARINADGSLDATFNPNLAGSLTPQVNAIVLQGDGKIIVGGGFTTAQPNGAATPTTRNRIARLNADGSLDTGFNPNANNMVLSLALQLDGKILVGGGFTTLQPNGAASATTRNRIARLNTDGSLDTAFDPGADNAVSAILVQPDSTILVGGSFTSFAANGSAAIVRNCFAKLNADGTVNTSFVYGAGGNVVAITRQADGKILVGGYFTNLRGNGSNGQQTRNYAGRFNVDGTLDATFNPNLNYVVNAFAQQADGSLILGGNFNSIQPDALGAALTRNRLARISATSGAVDATFAPESSGRPLAVAVQPDGKVVIAGTFSSVGGFTRVNIARLNVDGTLDIDFAPVVNGQVSAIAVQPDGRILIGGKFTTVNGVTRNYFARLNYDGSTDSVFNPGPNGAVNAIAVQSDGKVVFGGAFSIVTRHNSIDPNLTDLDDDTYIRSHIARVNYDGTLDETYNPSADNTVLTLKIQSDGMVLVGGSFQTLQPNNDLSASYRSGVARLKTDGYLDSFDPSVNGPVSAIAIQSDGKIVLGGAFTTISRHNDVDPNTKDTDDDRTTRNRIARVSSAGVLDETFDPNLNGQVITLAIQSDGKILAGGSFTTAQPNGASDWTARKYFARINPDGTLDSNYDLNLDERTDNQVTGIVIQSDGKEVLIGNFLTLTPRGTSTTIPRSHIARLNADGSIDTAYNPGANGQAGVQVSALAVQADGKVIAGGQFSNVGGTSGTNLTRFRADGTPDPLFTPNVNGPVTALAVQPNSGAIAPQTYGLALLEPTGRLHTAFSPPPDSQINGEIHAMVVQPDGKIIVGGVFSTVSTAVGENLVRYNTDGTIDTSFNPSPNAVVSALALQADGKVVVGGSFTSIAGNARNYLVRLNADGSLDGNFNPQPDALISSLAVQPDGKILVGGFFTSVTIANVNTARNYFMRLNADGTLDTNFNPQPNGVVYAILQQPDGKIVLGGVFTTLKPNGASTTTDRLRMARINADGTLDTNFDPKLNNTVFALALQPDGKIVAGGTFTTAQPNGAASTTTRNNIARFNADGTLDTNFDPYANSTVSTLALQSDGKIVLGGAFTTLQPAGTPAATTRNHIARINADGSVDTTFDPSTNANVASILVQSDGTLLVGGSFSTLQPFGTLFIGGAFTTVNGAPAPNFALLNDDGTVNSTFLPNADGAVSAFGLSPDGKIFVGGNFTHIGGQARNRAARFGADGVLDASFNPDVNATISVAAMQSDGKIVIGGSFTTVGGGAHPYLARLNTSGSADSGFNPSVTGAVNALAVQPDGKVVVAIATSGSTNRLARFNSDGSTDSSFAPGSDGQVLSIVMQADGRMIVTGSFNTIAGLAQPRTARLNADGTADATFRPSVSGTVSAVAIQTDGKPVIGGVFTSVDTLPRFGLARLAATDSAFQSITLGNGTITWTRSGTSPVLSSVTFEQSTDQRTWTLLGTATRSGNSETWTLSAALNSTVFAIRAHGLAPSGHNGSSGAIESVRQFDLSGTPVFTQPTTANGGVGSSFLFAVVATGSPTTYSASGLPPGLTIDPSTGVISGTPTAPGTYSVTVGASNAVGSTTSTLVIVVSPTSTGGNAPASGHFANLSALVQIDSTHPLVEGFVIGGNQPRTMVLRAVGPGLAQFGVGGYLAAPRLLLYNGQQQLILDTGAWNGSTSLSSAFSRVGAFPLAVGSTDSAALVTLAPGDYSIQVRDSGTAGGMVLAEIYDAGGDSAAESSRLINVSVLGVTDSSGHSVTSGFVITGNSPRRLLIRGAGPSLPSFGVQNALSDPVLSVYNQAGQFLALNNNWETPVTVSSQYPASSGSDIATAASGAGAFSFTSGSKDAALIITLPPGVYSAQAVGGSGSTGTAVVEVYELH